MKYKITCILLFLTFHLSYGQIVSWEMNTNNGDEVLINATTLNAFLNTSTLSRGNGLNADAQQDTYSSNNFTVNGTQTNSITNNDYLEFQISASNGYQVSLSTLDATFRRSNNGPDSFLWRYSIDGAIFTDLSAPFIYDTNGGNGTIQAQIDLTVIPAIQNVSFGTTITFRLYGWGATNANNGSFAIGKLPGDDLSVNGTVNAIPCFGGNTYTWQVGGWDIPGTPTINDSVIIDAPYNTATVNENINACSLTVYNILTISDGFSVQVANDVIVDGGEINISSQGALIQNGDAGSAGTFTLQNAGTASLIKNTREYSDDGLHYTYWSSPVENANITAVFPNPDDNRRYYFDAALFLDSHSVGMNDGIPDDIDDDGNDWQVASALMSTGVGYAVTAVAPPPVPSPFPYTSSANFTGKFNTGDFNVRLYRNDNETDDSNWNLIGNPYPSAISTDAFFTENVYDVNPTGTLEGVIYLWTHNSTASAANTGNQAYNFNQDDYAIINFVGGVSSGDQAVTGGQTPNNYIPSGQGFFVIYSNDAPTTGGASPVFSNTVSFRNSMRVTGNNDQFFRTNNKSKDNKLWLNLKSDNGVFNQMLVAYKIGATQYYDGMAYDAPRNLSSGVASILYSNIEGSTKKFAIQGKAPSNLTDDEIISIGYKTSIDVPTIYSLSIAQIEGDFLNNSPIYIKDNLLNKLHDLKTGDYNFTSEVGEFNNRFEIVFNQAALSIGDIAIDDDALSIIEFNNGDVQFKLNATNNISNIKIIDLQGRILYNFKVDSKDETLNLSNLSQAPYIAKITLDNNLVITKKAIKKY